MHASPLRNPIPQRHSHDLMTRVRCDGLADLLFEQLYTEPDLGVLEDARNSGLKVRRAGITEWQACMRHSIVSLAWDWIELSDGALRALRHVPPRSNLKIIDRLGYDLSDADSTAHIWHRIDALAWQGVSAALPAYH